MAQLGTLQFSQYGNTPLLPSLTPCSPCSPGQRAEGFRHSGAPRAMAMSSGEVLGKAPAAHPWVGGRGEKWPEQRERDGVRDRGSGTSPSFAPYRAGVQQSPLAWRVNPEAGPAAAPGQSPTGGTGSTQPSSAGTSPCSLSSWVSDSDLRRQKGWTPGSRPVYVPQPNGLTVDKATLLNDSYCLSFRN